MIKPVINSESFYHKLVIFFCTALLLSSCSLMGEDEAAPLEGERISILELQKSLQPDSTETEKSFSMPSIWRNEFWPQAGGYPNHAMQHLELAGTGLKHFWSADIGSGTTDELPLTAQPIVADGLVFTQDTDAVVSAFSVQDGKRLWHIDVQDEEEDDPVIGGGLSYAQGTLFMTTGYDEVLAITPAEGKLIWRVRIPSAARAAPTIIENRLFVATLDNRLIAMDTMSGTILWEYSGLSAGAGLVGAASPAANRETIIPAFSSGEIFALRAENGSVAWAENLSSLRAAGGLGGLSDIKALPVIDKGIVIAISFGGRMAAIDERTGTRIWQREIGGSETPWIAGNYIFVISSDNELISLNRNNGTINWITALPRYENPKKRAHSIFWTGPILAGGRLMAFSSNGQALDVNPANGDIIKSWATKKNIAIAPTVANGVLYLLSEDGTLTAYR